MRVLITGGGGFLGQKLARALGQNGKVAGHDITAMELVDVVKPARVAADFPVHSHVCDISEPSGVAKCFDNKPDFIWHLAAVVSGSAEADLDLGLRVNLNGTINIYEAARAAGNCPTLIYASSCAVHGGEEPVLITDGVELNPQTSYGAQKAMGELLLNDFSRRGLIDGRGLRLPSVSIRPGKANAAASSFMSSIFRDTMQGDTSNCPVARDFPVWHSPPRIVVANLIHAAEIDGRAFGANRNLNLPGRTDTIGAMIDAMSEVSGPEAADRITWNADPVIEKIVRGWRAYYQPDKAEKLGFVTSRSFADSVRWFLAEDIRK